MTGKMRALFTGAAVLCDNIATQSCSGLVVDMINQSIKKNKII